MGDEENDEAAGWAERARTVDVGGEAVAVVDVPAGGGAGDRTAGDGTTGDGTTRGDTTRGDTASGDTTGDGTAGDGGVPLLVVHGFPTSSVDFAPIVDRLAERRRVVLLDLPGYGLSAKPDRPYSLFAQADVVEAVATATGLTGGEVDLLTHD